MKQQNNNQIYHAALYCRLSKDDEDRNGDSSSIRTQKSLLEHYCKKHGYIIYDFYVDDGYSGLNFERPDFQRLLNDIDKGLVNMVITKDLSRLGRDYIQTGYYTEIYFSQKQVRYIAINDAFDSNLDDNDFAPFRHILNDMYAKDLSRKVKTAKKQRALSGLFISAQAPFRYKPSPNNRNKLIIDEPAATIVKKIYSLALSGYSPLKIAKQLSSEGIITPGVYKYQQGDKRFARYLNKDKKRWCHETIHKILKDRVYIGDMVNHKAEITNYKTKQRVLLPESEHIVVQNTHESIINRSDWETVQRLIKSRHRAPYHNFENIFRGIVFCSDCGNRLCMGTKKRNDNFYHYYRCNNHYLNPNKCLKPHQISYSALYENVLSQIQELIKAVNNDRLFLKLVQNNKSINRGSSALEKEALQIDMAIATLSTKVRKLFESHTKGIINYQNYEMLMHDLQEEQKAFKLKKTTVQAKLTDLRTSKSQLDQFKTLIKSFSEIEKLNYDILNTLIKRIDIGSLEDTNGKRLQKVAITWNF